MTALLAQSKAHAEELVDKLIAECLEGISDREAEARAIATLWCLEVDVPKAFAEARVDRKPEKPAPANGPHNRYRLFGPGTKPEPKPVVGPPIEAAHKVSEAGDFKLQLLAAQAKPKAQPKVSASKPAVIVRRARILRWEDLDIPASASDIERLTYVPGVVGEFVDWTAKTAIRPNRIMALGAGLVVVGTLIGHQIRGPKGAATHLYIIILAKTGIGKDHPLVCGRRVFEELNLKTMIGPSSFTSSVGFEEQLLATPVMACFLDEIGDTFGLLNQQHDNSFIKNTIGKLKQAYNAWGGWGMAPTKGNPGPRIEWPAPSLFGVATPEMFFSSLTPMDLESGFANRMVIMPFECHRLPPENPESNPQAPIPKRLLEAFEGLPRRNISILDRGINSGKIIGKPELIDVDWTPEAAEVYHAFSHKLDELQDGDKREFELSRRVGENSIRLALVVAVGRGSRVIEVGDINWSIAWMERSFDAAVGGAERYLTEYLKFPKFCERVADFIRTAPIRGVEDGHLPFMPEYRIFDRFQNNQQFGNELDRVLKQLIRAHQIKWFPSSRGERGPESGGGYGWIGGDEKD